MSGRRRLVLALGLALVAATGALFAAPWLVRAYWAQRASNPVRRGVHLARELGCFSCHGALGEGGLPDPTARSGEVPAWSGGTWMMYVDNDVQIREYIRDGISATRSASPTAKAERARQTIVMPAYGALLDERELDDLVATFRVLSRMHLPDAGSPERAGYDLAQRWRCFDCHGPAGSGGLPNPRSFSGTIPGWYGAEFDDLVRGRAEFDAWIREGSIDRLSDSRVAAWFVERQRVSMPAYRGFEPAELDALWAYVQWLARTEGGHRGDGGP